MKKLKKSSNPPSSRTIKPSHYKQNRNNEQPEGFVLRNDVFAFIGAFINSSRQQMQHTEQ